MGRRRSRARLSSATGSMSRRSSATKIHQRSMSGCSSATETQQEQVSASEISCQAKKTRGGIVHVPVPVPPDLPIDIISMILVFVPAEILYRVMRCVCKEWHDIINHPSFIAEQLRLAPNGGVSQLGEAISDTSYLEITGDELKLKTGLLGSLTFDHSHLLGSCHGLLMIVSLNRRHKINVFPRIQTTEDPFICTYFVANPVTKQLVRLPDMHGFTYDNHHYPGLGYAASVNAYKVVAFVIERIKSPESAILEVGSFRILTVRVDTSWRSINARTTPTDENGRHTDPAFCRRPPYWINGFIYWAALGYPYVRRLNLDTELFQVYPIPKFCEKKVNYFSPMGDFLSMVCYSRGERKFDVWVLKQAAEFMTWTKLYEIDLRYTCLHGYMLENKSKLEIVCWLSGGEFLLFQTEDGELFITLNVKTHKVYDMNSTGYPCAVYHHLPSLVSI